MTLRESVRAEVPPSTVWPRLTVSVDEAAHLLGIGRGLAYEAVRRGELPAVRIGRRIRVPYAQLLARLGTNREEKDPASSADLSAQVALIVAALESNDADVALRLARDLEADLKRGIL